VYVPSIFFLDKVLSQLLDHAIAGPFSGVLDGCFVGLGQFPTPTLGPNNVIADITEANYDGYARLPLTWRGPYLNPLGQPSIQADGNYFVPTVSNQIVMMFIADALTAGNLLLSTPLPGGPVFLSNPTTAFALSQVFQLLTGNNYGTPIVIQ
jgi:hypothetical protein